MKMHEILDVIKSLAPSQGFYGRLYRRLMELADEDPESYEMAVQELEDQNFQDSVDLILYLEG